MVTWRYLRQAVGNGWFTLLVYMIHIGQVIKEELHNQDHTVAWLAEELCCDRTNIYKLFRRKSIDTNLLFRISRILSHNFFKYYTEWL